MRNYCPEPRSSGQARNVLMENANSSGSDQEDSGSDDDFDEEHRVVVDPAEHESLKKRLQELKAEDAKHEKTLTEVRGKTEVVKKRMKALDDQIEEAGKELEHAEHPALWDIAVNERAKSKTKKEILEAQEEMRKAKAVWKQRRKTVEAKLVHKKSEVKKIELRFTESHACSERRGAASGSTMLEFCRW